MNVYWPILWIHSLYLVWLCVSHTLLWKFATSLRPPSLWLGIHCEPTEEKSTCCVLTSGLCACVNTDCSAMCPSPVSHLLKERVQLAATGGGRESGNSWFAHLAVKQPFDVSSINGVIYGGGGRRKLAWQQLVFSPLTLFTSTFVAAAVLTLSTLLFFHQQWVRYQAIRCSHGAWCCFPATN